VQHCSCEMAGSSVGRVASLVNCDWNGKMSLTA
jgi:hypothetical protein